MLWSGRPLLLGSSSRPTPALPVHLGLRATTRCLSSKDGKADNPYNHTVNLPRTSFGMRANSAVQEPKIQAFWESEGIYESLSRNNPGAPFTLHDGPPYANGDLHIGHALNKILKDFINRYQLLRGRKAAFVPGWDCHGLPIELKALQAQQGASAAKGDAKSKKGGAERSSHPSPAPAPVPSPDAPESILALRATCAAFALAALDRQRAQFRRYGVWGDWGAPYVTLDPRYEAAQVRVFGAMALAGHVYRGLRPVHWSPASGTALAEAELEYPEAHVSQAAYVALPLSQPGPDLSSEQRRLLAGAALAVWTTTPWTLPANLAAAVHPGLQYAVVELDMPAQEASAGFGSEGGCCKSGASPLFPPSPASAPPAPVYAVRRLVVAADLAESLAATFGARSSAVLGTLAGRSLTQSLYRHPLVRRESPVLPADWVSADAGTGIVHCAPGHGMEDWQLGQAWGIGVLSPVDEQGRFTPEAGLPELQGLQVLGSGSDAALAALKRRGALLSVHQHAHKYPYDWRSKTPTIVRATQQWFASVGGFREAALKAGRGVQWVPSAGGARLEAMIAQRGDWCISRQRRWGVPIPAFYDLKSGEAVVDQETVEHVAQVFERQGSDAWWKLPLVDLLPGSKKHLAGSLRRGQDTMDVWFDSGSSWAGALGGLAGRNGAASTASLAGFNQPGSSPASPTASSPPPLNFPADVYLEGSDQSRGWFQSSLLTSVAVTGQAPFKTVLTHGFVLDERGAKMSKSLGNVVDPMGVILGGRGRPALGADVLRLWAASVDYSADVGVGDRALEAASESYKKLRLTLRYLLGNLSDFDPGRHALNASQLPLSDRAIVHRALELKSAAEAAYDEFKFYRAAALTQRFCSAELSAGHLDALKDRLYTSAPDADLRRAGQTGLAAVLQILLPVLAPLLPHLAEDAWQSLPWPAPCRSAFQGGWNLSWGKPFDPVAAGQSELSSRDLADADALRRLRAGVNAALERARAAGRIGSSLDARAVLFADDPDIRARLRALQREQPRAASGPLALDELRSTLIVSQVRVADAREEAEACEFVGRAAFEAGSDVLVGVSPAQGSKCARCWNWSERVGAASSFPDLCERCLPVVQGGQFR